MVKLNKGDNLAIDLTSDSFDSIVTLAANGSTSQKMMTAQMVRTNSLPASQRQGHISFASGLGETGVGSLNSKSHGCNLSNLF